MLEKVKEIIEDKLSLEGVEITEATRFKEDLEADSLDLFDMVMDFEETFGIEIPSEDLENLKTVGDVISYIESKQA
ncbi:MAG: acyl carrier protein [Lachnospiraceae bacterium]